MWRYGLALAAGTLLALVTLRQRFVIITVTGDSMVPALSPGDSSPFHSSFKFQSDASEILAKGHNIQTSNAASKICRRPAFAEGRYFIKSIEIFSRAEAHGMR